MKTFRSHDGVVIAYREWGTDTAKPPVVLHHGFIADAHFNWVLPGIVDALVAAGHRVAAHDARGHGHSGKPHDPAAYGEQIMARDLACFFDVIGAAAVDLVGYSMGAIVSLIAAAQDSRIRRLVVGGVGAAVVEVGGVDTRVLPAEVLVAALETDDPTTITNETAARFRAFADRVGADRTALAAHAAAVHASPIALDRITVPTLILAGEDDLAAARPEALAAAIRGARLQIVSGDHFSALVDPRFTEVLIAFLA